MLQAIHRGQPATRGPAQKSIQQAVYSAHRLWAKRYPQWEAAFFDEHFLRTRVLPLLRERTTMTPRELAQAWTAQFYRGVQRESKLLVELTPVAADFLYFVEGELRYFEEEAQRPTVLQQFVWWLRDHASRRTTEPRCP
jgi:hypothetical protein